MITETINYIDLDGKPQQEIAHFMLRRDDMADLMDLQPRLEAWDAITKEPQRKLTTPEVQEMLALTKIFIEKSYGRREGKFFRKKPEYFEDFRDCGAYDVFLFGLFTDPEKGNAFMENVMPPEMREQVIEMAKTREDAVAAGGEVPSITDLVEKQQSKPEEEFDPSKDFTPQEMQNLSHKQMQAAMAYRMGKR